MTDGGRTSAAQTLHTHGVRVWSGSRFLRFGFVGTVAAFTDMGVVQALVSASLLDLYSARVVSYLVAATVAWALNRRLTFGISGSAGRLAEWGRYLGLNLGGAAINYAIYALLVSRSAFFATWPFAAVALGSLAGMLVNYTLVRLWVFRPP